MTQSAIEIRPMKETDWEFVRSIYLEGIATRQATFEDYAPAWDAWNTGHLPAPRLVATTNEHLVGWAALNRVSTRAVYAGVAEVSIYVGQGSRGQRVGSALLARLVSDAETHGIWTLQASVFPENAASVRLHESCGFRVVGARERIGKMDGVWRNTLLLERRSARTGLD